MYEDLFNKEFHEFFTFNAKNLFNCYIHKNKPWYLLSWHWWKYVITLPDLFSCGFLFSILMERCTFSIDETKIQHNLHEFRAFLLFCDLGEFLFRSFGRKKNIHGQMHGKCSTCVLRYKWRKRNSICLELKNHVSLVNSSVWAMLPLSTYLFFVCVSCSLCCFVVLVKFKNKNQIIGKVYFCYEVC